MTFLKKPARFFLLFGIAAAVFTGCFTVPFKAVQYEPGTYEGSGQGFRGLIRVLLSVSASGIENIEILDHREDEASGGAAIEELRDYILELSLSVEEVELDALSGATVSRKGFLDAVANALSKARQ